MKRFTGFAILGTLFLSLVIWCSIDIGIWWAGPAIWGGAVAVCYLIVLAINLIMED